MCGCRRPKRHRVGRRLREVGPEGAALQDEIVSLCHDAGLSLLGPNCIGQINTQVTGHGELRLVHARHRHAAGRQHLDDRPKRGTRDHGRWHTPAPPVSDSATPSAPATKRCSPRPISSPPARDDAETDVIGLYIEGTRNGPKFIAALEKARDRGKPVVCCVAEVRRLPRALRPPTPAHWRAPPGCGVPYFANRCRRDPLARGAAGCGAADCERPEPAFCQGPWRRAGDLRWRKRGCSPPTNARRTA